MLRSILFCLSLSVVLFSCSPSESEVGLGLASQVLQGDGGGGEPPFFIMPTSFMPTPGQRISLDLRAGMVLPGETRGWADITPDFFMVRSAGEQWINAPEQGLVCPRAGHALLAFATAPTAGGVQYFMKAILDVRSPGEQENGASAMVMAKAGVKFEIVPLLDPASLGPGDDFPLEVLFAGSSLAGVEVVARLGDRPLAEAIKVVTDGGGSACLRLQERGTWLISTRYRATDPAWPRGTPVLHLATLVFTLVEEGS